MTNGTLLRSRRDLAAAAACDFVAVSVDGPPEHHDRIRRSADAFRHTAQGITRLRDAGIRYGITSTVDRDVLPFVPDLHVWAREQGAELLGLRPLAPVGRAAIALQGQGLTPPELARLVLMTRLLDTGSAVPRSTPTPPRSTCSSRTAVRRSPAHPSACPTSSTP
ncbi:hypothetical protein [Nonomuraea sp. JJY05]|uniref:hypothetical protein n=1 Tax=Nonomuraea sp. JJY05 TaxID=3350255 RepID=UPI00373DFA09